MATASASASAAAEAAAAPASGDALVASAVFCCPLDEAFCEARVDLSPSVAGGGGTVVVTGLADAGVKVDGAADGGTQVATGGAASSSDGTGGAGGLEVASAGAGGPSTSVHLRPYGTIGRPEGRVWIGRYRCDLTSAFWRECGSELGASVSLRKVRGDNAHHIVESTFKVKRLTNVGTLCKQNLRQPKWKLCL